MQGSKSVGSKLSVHQRLQLIKAAQLTGSRIIADGKIIYSGSDALTSMVTIARNLYDKKGATFEKKLDGTFKKIVIKDYEHQGWVTAKEINLEVINTPTNDMN